MGNLMQNEMVNNSPKTLADTFIMLPRTSFDWSNAKLARDYRAAFEKYKGLQQCKRTLINLKMFKICLDSPSQAMQECGMIQLEVGPIKCKD